MPSEAFVFPWRYEVENGETFMVEISDRNVELHVAIYLETAFQHPHQIWLPVLKLGCVPRHQNLSGLGERSSRRVLRCLPHAPPTKVAWLPSADAPVEMNYHGISLRFAC